MSTRRPFVLSGLEVTGRHVDRVGGKGVNLAALRRFGLRVPPWYAVSTDAFRTILDDTGASERIAELLRRLAADTEPLDRIAQEIRDRILALELPEDLSREIAERHGATIPADSFVAVRSSATEEDTPHASFAGLHDSFLFVRGHDHVLDATRRVWGSAYNERALAYRRERGISTDRLAVGVVVQEMIDADTSGVLFTVNPTNGDVHEIVVSSLFGAGEGLVSVGLNADTFVVDKETLEVEEDIVEKDEQMVRDPGDRGGLARVPVPGPRRNERSLSPEQVREVANAGLVIERAFRFPQDVEFCYEPGRGLHVLQTRPVTTAEEIGPAGGNEILWDNSNIIESYSGVTSPMTFSFIRHAYSIVYHCFSEVMGISPAVVRRNRRTFENMLGLVRGQVYYNLMNWHRLIRLFPGYEYNRRFMESMMGVQESTSLDDGSPVGWSRRYLRELPPLVRLVLRTSWNFVRIRRIVSRFQDLFERHYARWERLDLSTLPAHELLSVYWEMEDELLWNWKAPIINDFYVMVFYGILKKLCESWCREDSGSLQNDLLCGEGNIASTEPTKLLLQIAAQASSDPELSERFRREDPEDLAVDIPRDPRHVRFAASVSRYLDLYGFRCANELKLEEPSLKERPAFLYQMIQNYIVMDDPSVFDLRAKEEQEQRVRREAESRAWDMLGRSRWRRSLFSRVLRNARLGVKNRENLRFARTRIYGLLREVIRAIGRRLAEERLIEREDDVFYLTLDEVRDFIHGTAVTTDLRGLVELRRREFDAFRGESDRMPADRFATYGMVYGRNRFRGRRSAATSEEPGVLRGIGCCPGRVTAPVKVLLSLTTDARLSGEILVAGRTDPGWIPLYPSASGILIERGSILSHSAIVAREMGIPTIVGVPGLTSALVSGQRVEMDGSTGTIRIVDEDVTSDATTE